jgi:hypothetical protein
VASLVLPLLHGWGHLIPSKAVGVGLTSSTWLARGVLPIPPTSPPASCCSCLPAAVHLPRQFSVLHPFPMGKPFSHTNQKKLFFWGFCGCFSVVLGFELRAPCLLGKYSVFWPMPPSLSILFFWFFCFLRQSLDM